MRLTRKPGEGVELFRGSETVAKITIREISPGRVSIDIVAPLSVEILRSELIDRETDKDAIEVDYASATIALRRRQEARRPNPAGDRGGHATIRRRAGWFILSRTKDGKGAHSQNASEGPRRWVSEDFRD